MTLTARLLLGVSLSALLHGGLWTLYVQRDSGKAQIVLGEQSDITPLSIAMFKPTEKITVSAQVKTVVKKAVTPALKKTASPKPSTSILRSEKSVVRIKPKAIIKASSEDAPAAPEEVAKIDMVKQEAVQARHSSTPVLNTEPVYYSQKAPRYPRKALLRGQQGTVLLMLLVNEQGRVIETQVIKSSGISSLDKAARTAVKSWRLQPAESKGVAIASRVKVPVKFNLVSG